MDHSDDNEQLYLPDLAPPKKYYGTDPRLEKYLGLNKDEALKIGLQNKENIYIVPLGSNHARRGFYMKDRLNLLYDDNSVVDGGNDQEYLDISRKHLELSK